MWTGWSHRGLANVLEISHPTVSALEQGTSPARVGDLFDRLVEAHEVVRRVHLIAASQPFKDQPPVAHTVGIRRQRRDLARETAASRGISGRPGCSAPASCRAHDAEHLASKGR